MDTFGGEDRKHGMREMRMVGRTGEGWLVRSIGLRWR